MTVVCLASFSFSAPPLEMTTISDPNDTSSFLLHSAAVAPPLTVEEAALIKGFEGLVNLDRFNASSLEELILDERSRSSDVDYFVPEERRGHRRRGRSIDFSQTKQNRTGIH